MLLLPSFLLNLFVERLSVYISSLPVVQYQPIPSSSIIKALKKSKATTFQRATSHKYLFEKFPGGLFGGRQGWLQQTKTSSFLHDAKKTKNKENQVGLKAVFPHRSS